MRRRVEETTNPEERVTILDMANSDSPGGDYLLGKGSQVISFFLCVNPFNNNDIFDEERNIQTPNKLVSVPKSLYIYQ